jgi:hypothetical protein
MEFVLDIFSGKYSAEYLVKDGPLSLDLIFRLFIIVLITHIIIKFAFFAIKMGFACGIYVFKAFGMTLVVIAIILFCLCLFDAYLYMWDHDNTGFHNRIYDLAQKFHGREFKSQFPMFNQTLIPDKSTFPWW